MIITQDFTSSASLKAHYRAVNARLSGPKTIKAHKPKPTPKPLNRMWVFAAVTSLSPIAIHPLKDRGATVGEGHILRDNVLRATGLSLADFLSHRRSKDVVRPRFVFWWLCRKYTDLSFPQIGRLSGGRDHCTVINGIRRVENNMPEFAKLIAAIETPMTEAA